MTEEEAKTKRCCGPEGCGLQSAAPADGWEKYIFGNHTTADRILATVAAMKDNGAARHCVGSACMAWRGTRELENTQGDSGPPAGDGWTKDGPPTGLGGGVTHRQMWRRMVGYCGLAGKP